MDEEKPLPDVLDQQRLARPDEMEFDEAGLDESEFGGSMAAGEPIDELEADPTDVADQRRVAPVNEGNGL